MCIGCKCLTCGNEVGCGPLEPGECDFFCYNCEDCGSSAWKKGWTNDCPNYKVSEQTRKNRARIEEEKARKNRAKFTVVKN